MIWLRTRLINMDRLAVKFCKSNEFNVSSPRSVFSYFIEVTRNRQVSPDIRYELLKIIYFQFYVVEIFFLIMASKFEFRRVGVTSLGISNFHHPEFQRSPNLNPVTMTSGAFSSACYCFLSTPHSEKHTSFYCFYL